MEKPIPRSALVRAKFLALIGMPVSACILVADVLLLGALHAGGTPPTRSELIDHALFGVLSATVLVVASRAWWRGRRGARASIAPLLTRLVPVLLALGVFGGVGLGVMFGRIGVAATRSRAIGICQKALDQPTSDEAVSPEARRCMPIALACRAERVGGACRSRSRVGPNESVPNNGGRS